MSTSTSRAYWELRAEQVMDRVFRPLDDPGTPPAPAAATEQGESIEVEVREESPVPPQPARTTLLWLCGGITGLALLGAGVLGVGWNRTSQELRQERTIQLLQAVRELGGAGERSAQPRDAGPRNAGEPTPPPPPSEPWMEQLSELDANGGAGGVPPLQVPVNGPLTTPAPAAAPPPVLGQTPQPAGAPELVGVVQSPGRSGSAIFRLNGSFTNASSGESIGGSGWRLLSASGDSALIERGGASRRVSIGSGF